MKLPFLTANFAITADGKISTRAFTRSDFSSKADKRRLLEIRAGCDAVLVGARTLASDQMTMGLPAADLQAQRRKRGLPSHPLHLLPGKTFAWLNRATSQKSSNSRTAPPACRATRC